MPILDTSAVWSLPAVPAVGEVYVPAGLCRAVRSRADRTLQGSRLSSAAYNASTGTLTLTNVVISGNTAGGFGGGIDNDGGTMVCHRAPGAAGVRVW
jgi:hypothetical protein